MKIKALAILLAISLLAGLSGCAAEADSNLMKDVVAAGWPTTADQPDADYTQSMQAFAWKLMQETMADDGNVLISPSSVYLALAMTLNGADTDTLTAMKNALMAQGLTDDQINQGSRNWIINNSHYEDFDLKIANSIWIREGYPVAPAFLQVNADFFAAAARQLDFSQPSAADTINGWINDKTEGKIEEVIDEIDPSTVMFLINAIYFLADWQDPFDGQETRDNAFQTPDGQVITKFMNRLADWQFVENDSASGVILPYKGGRFAMVALLPDDAMSARDLAGGMTAESFTALLASSSTQNGLVSLPKFETEYENSLKDALTALGMGVAFGGGADLSRMTASGDKGLFIGDVIHKTFIRVDEEGTEAAAVTVVEILESAMPMPDQSLVFDRPFVYGIVDLETGVPLFLGILDDPTA